VGFKAVKTAIALTVAALVAMTGCSVPKAKNTNRSLENWILWGIGERTVETDGTVRLSENKRSKGVMLISPEPVKGDCILRYDVQAATEQTVLVTLFSLSNKGTPDSLVVPDSYDGNVEWLLNNTQGYFVAFANRAHTRKPFIRKLPHDLRQADLVEASKHYIHPGQWYRIEVGMQKGRLFLKVDGKTIIETIDRNGLNGGHLGLRIRGTKTGLAECRIRHSKILR